MHTELSNGRLGHPFAAAPTRPLPPAMRAIVPLLKQLRGGVLRIEYPEGGVGIFGEGGRPLTLRMHDWRMCGAVLRAGDIGLAEAYVDGAWSCDDLPAVLALLNRNRAALERVIYGSLWGGLAYRLRHLLNRNSKSGSRRNIHAHYDIGNAFYRLWLDPSMTYSSALYSGTLHQGATTLEQAQAAKYRRILDQLALQAGERVLEIGCGWGGFAEMAAKRGAHVTGLTLSTEQLEYARERLQRARVDDRCTLLLQDYRDTHGSYDAIASIEMFEAVGERYWPDYFACLARNLKPGGRACVQTIVIDDALFPRYRKGSDFIQQTIFPGGMLPSPSVFRRHAAAAGLRVTDAYTFGPDYARTLAEWRERFLARSADVLALGFDERFMRTWEFYLAYCEAGFGTGSIDVVQFTLERSA